MKPQLLCLCLVLTSSLLQAQVVINEVLYTAAPEGGGNSFPLNSLLQGDGRAECEDDAEWIELFNTEPCQTIDVGCHIIANRIDVNSAGAFFLPPGTTINPYGHLVIGANEAPNADFNVLEYRDRNDNSIYQDGRWYLQDEHGWVGFYAPDGSPVQAVYWAQKTTGYKEGDDMSGITQYTSNLEDIPVPDACGGGTITLQSLSDINNAGLAVYAGGFRNTGIDSTVARTVDGDMTWTSYDGGTPGDCNNDDCLENPFIQVGDDVVSELCFGTNGSITLTNELGGGSVYTYAWDHGPTSNMIDNLSADNSPYVVTVTDQNNCSAQFTYNIERTGSIDLEIASEPDECDAGVGSVRFVDAFNGTPNYTFQWTNSAGAVISNTETAEGLNAGNYTLTITDANLCQDQKIIAVDNNSVTLGASDSEIIELNREEFSLGETIEIKIVPQGNWETSSFLLNAQEINEMSYAFEATETGVFTVTTELNLGDNCVELYSREFEIFPNFEVYIPNAFVGGKNSSENNYFKPVYVGAIDRVEGMIFDRWGQLVTTFNSTTDTWDGTYKTKDAPMDVYVYKFKVWGANPNLPPRSLIGHVSLLR